MIGRRGCWLSLAMLMLVSVSLAMAMRLERPPRIFTVFYRLATEAPKLLAVLVAPALFLLFFVLLARWELNVGGRARTSGELGRLLQHKRTGILRQAAKRIRRSTTPSGPNAAGSGRTSHDLLTPCPSPNADLDRLVQKKRSERHKGSG
jgi:hypothetical protein